MSNQLLKEKLPKEKNYKIQVYYPEQVGTETPEYKKHYIYAKYKKDSGGLFAYYRQLSMKEILDSQLEKESVNAQFIINYNSKIKSNMFIEFKNPITKEIETYGIVGQPDAYEGYKTDITLNCYSVLDSNDYTGEAYDE